MKTGKLALGAGVLAVALATSGGTAFAEEHRHAGGHEHDAAAWLALDHGRKWDTDASLREGMSRIRGIVEPRLDAVNERKLTHAQYRQMARGIEGEIAYIVDNCKLDPRADAVLHSVIAELGEGVEALANESDEHRPEAGVARIVRTLDDYGTYFDHPGWKPIRSGH